MSSQRSHPAEVGTATLLLRYAVPGIDPYMAHLLVSGTVTSLADHNSIDAAHLLETMKQIEGRSGRRFGDDSFAHLVTAVTGLEERFPYPLQHVTDPWGCLGVVIDLIAYRLDSMGANGLMPRGKAPDISTRRTRCEQHHR